MNKQEFEARIGRTATNEEFDRAENAYTAAGNMDKDTFCSEWKALKLDKSYVINELVDSLEHVKQQNRKSEKTIEALINLLAANCEEEVQSDRIGEFVGKKRWILAKIDNQVALNESDLLYIKNFLY